MSRVEQASSPEIVNISSYLFTELDNLKDLRAKILVRAKELNLKGTILLSREGINLFVAGDASGIELLLADLRQVPGLGNLTPKISRSAHQPFNRMLVRIKKEIIAFGVPEINPAKRTSPKLPPRELKQWLDEGRPVTLLDTRNEYEIKLGTFTNATRLGINHFRDFPKAVEALPETMKEAPIVMFCTGGIRCEKAGPFMESRGFKNIFQLEGGILKYFEECGSAHYDGDCFVFDQRVGVDPQLEETPNSQCFVCLSPLTSEEQEDKRYELGVSCPYCFKTSDAQMEESISRRHARLAEISSPLPGSVPYENRRPLTVPLKFDRLPLLDFLCQVLKHISRENWEKELADGKILGPDLKPQDRCKEVRSGERYFHLMPVEAEPDVATDIRIIYEDEALFLIEKPAPLPVHSGGRFHRNTLQYFLNELYAPQIPRPAHRLDANTTGLMLIARTKHFAGLLQTQFSKGEVKKGYLARVQGHPAQDQFRCEIPIGEEVQELGGRRIDAEGLTAITDFRVLMRYSDGTSLLKVMPVTGRTNQIRIHLSELGFPIRGESLYLKGEAATRQTNALNDTPLCLQSQSLTFKHPLTQKRMTFEVDLPAWSN